MSPARILSMFATIVDTLRPHDGVCTCRAECCNSKKLSRCLVVVAVEQTNATEHVSNLEANQSILNFSCDMIE